MECHAISAERCFEALNSSENGLSSDDARSRLAKFGPNEIKEAPRKSILTIFLAQFSSLLIFVLIVAAVIAAFLGEATDAIAIVSILLMNAALGAYQEFRAESAVLALKKFSAPFAQTLRDGHLSSVPTRELVSGDVIIVEAGSIIPADCRIIKSAMLEVNEAILTGESMSSEKNAISILPESTQISQRSNSLFSGTAVVSGRATALITATGSQTEFGKIAVAVQSETQEDTPLRKQVDQVGKQLTKSILIACAFIFIVGVLRGIAAVDMLLSSVSLAVAAIPEGLPIVITIALAVGVQRMSKKNAIVRRLLAVEALGSVDVICTDKTGTLTKNEMTVRHVISLGATFEVEGTGYQKDGRILVLGRSAPDSEMQKLNPLLLVAALCNNSSVTYSADGNANVVGDPTEAALLVLSEKGGISRAAIPDAEFVAEFPFDPSRKMMSVVYNFSSSRKMVFSKGAPESILSRCAYYTENGERKKLDSGARARFISMNSEMASAGLRVIGFAERRIDDSLDLRKAKPSSVEAELEFIGLAGMRDAPREEAKQAIAGCRSAGIEVVMITGDNEETARAIASELELLKQGDLVVCGAELDQINDEKLAQMIGRIRVYARVSPEHKLRIVNAWKAIGKNVAMTGDGVNDAPALKRADISIAMGITGSDVTKEVSDIVLADDNFASIVSAVREGRGVYENIRKCLAYLLTGNITELVIIFAALVIGLPLPLAPVQLLWINLVTDGLPALALSADAPESDLLKRKPRKKGESIWTGMRIFLLDCPIMMAAISLLLFIASLNEGSLAHAQTMVFSFIIVSEQLIAFSSRDMERPIGRRIFGNKWLLVTLTASISLQMLLMYTPISRIFNVVPLTPQDWAVVVFAGMLGFAYLELAKFLRRSKTTHVQASA